MIFLSILGLMIQIRAASLPNLEFVFAFLVLLVIQMKKYQEIVRYIQTKDLCKKIVATVRHSKNITRQAAHKKNSSDDSIGIE